MSDKISYVRTTPRRRRGFTFNEHGSVSLVAGQDVSLNAVVAAQRAAQR